MSRVSKYNYQIFFVLLKPYMSRPLNLIFNQQSNTDVLAQA